MEASLLHRARQGRESAEKTTWKKRTSLVVRTLRIRNIQAHSSRNWLRFCPWDEGQKLTSLRNKLMRLLGQTELLWSSAKEFGKGNCSSGSVCESEASG